ncbi:hypothetical protein BFRIG_01862 [Peribacillus frigoritolerans]|uniref:hypothetical protein n=1 Tax=Peribacillus frigoritolerans TaxID=450367 RepID=UPI0030CB0091
MSYNFKHGNLPKQTQEILRQKKRNEDAQRDGEERRIEKVKEKVVIFLTETKKPCTVEEIAAEIKIKSIDVLKVVSKLTKEKKIELVIVKVGEVNITHYQA